MQRGCVSRHSLFSSIVMSLLRKIKSDSVEIILWEMTEMLEELSLLIDDGKDLLALARNTHKNEKRQREFLLARVLLKLHFGVYHEIEYLESGKPALRGGGGYVSISHTGKYFCLAYSKDECIGVDVECWSCRALRVVSKFLFAEEMKFLEAAPEKMATQLWSAKEAVFKLEGKAFDTISQIHLEQASEGFSSHSNGRAICVQTMDAGAFVLSVARYEQNINSIGKKK